MNKLKNGNKGGIFIIIGMLLTFIGFTIISLKKNGYFALTFMLLGVFFALYGLVQIIIRNKNNEN